MRYSEELGRGAKTVAGLVPIIRSIPADPSASSQPDTDG